MIEVTSSLSVADREAFEEMGDIPADRRFHVFRGKAAHQIAFVEDDRIRVVPVGFAPRLQEVTDAVRASDPRAAFDCRTDAMDGILDDYPIQWFRHGTTHYAVFVRNGSVEMHECDISYDQERIAS